VYSFKNKNLYTYDELPEVPFTFRINRKFPTFNQDALHDLMKQFVEPIFPDTDERKALLNRLAKF